MNIDAYQEQASKTRLKSYSAEACVMGLLSEAGEVAGVFQKLIRGDFTATQVGEKLHKELGDVLWHLAGVAYDNGWKLSDVAQGNLDKLESRMLRDKLMGSGDER